MKLKATISGSEHAISLNMMGSVVSAEVDGRSYDIEVRELARGEYLLVSGSSVYKCRVEQRSDSSPGEKFEVALRGHNYYLSLIDPKRLRSGQSSAVHHTGAAEIASPMPGKVVRVIAAEGANVEAGAGIIVVEAMKMQNELKAPKAGVVVSIKAEEGATVSAGDVLAVVE